MPDGLGVPERRRRIRSFGRAGTPIRLGGGGQLVAEHRGRLLAVARNIYSFLRALFVPGLVVEKLRLDESRKFAFGICIAAAVAGLLVLDRAGRLP